MLDKAALVLAAVEQGPVSLAELVAHTGLNRATAHRLASALEVHRLVGRDPAGRFVAGPRLAAAGFASPLPWELVDRADEILTELRHATGESTQLYVRRGALRLCVAASERASGLRDTVPVGAALPMTAGSGAQVLLAFADEPEPDLLEAAPFDAAVLAQVRERGWAQSVGERETGLGSVSAPVRGEDGAVIAAVSLSGPLERLTRTPGHRHGPAVVAAAQRLSATAVSG